MEERNITLEIPGIPITKARARYTNGHFFTPSTTKAAEEVIRNIARIKWTWQPSENPILVIAIFSFKAPLSCGPIKKNKLELGMYPKLSKPDTDNLMKLVKDSLNGIVYKDDNQVFFESGLKIYSTENSTLIYVAEFPQDAGVAQKAIRQMIMSSIANTI